MAVKATAKPSTVKSGSTESTAATAKSAATEAVVSLCHGV